MRHNKRILYLVILTLYLVIFPACAFIFLYSKSIPVSFEQFSVADLLILTNSPKLYISIMLLAIVVCSIYILKENNDVMRLLLNENKKKIFWIQEKKIFFISIYISLIYILVILVCGLSIGKQTINWGENSSYFAMIMKQTIEGIHLFNVIIVIFIMNVFRNLFFCNVIMAFWWKDISFVYGIILALGIALFDYFGSKIQFVLRGLNADYEFWLSKTEVLIAVVDIAIIITLIIIIRKIFVKRKEFLI